MGREVLLEIEIDCSVRRWRVVEVGLVRELTKLVQACLRAPLVVADEANLAIVFTYFFSFFFLLSFSPPSTFHPLGGISRA